MITDPASFRDDSGYVAIEGDHVYRFISAARAETWKKLKDCGLLAEAKETGLIQFAETDEIESAGLVLKSPRLPYITYPYEWTFGQLKEAALKTLELQKLAITHGCVLKDASAYNVQFNDGRPVFIDLLSFEPWKEGAPWAAYGQFTRHFLAPLALAAYTDPALVGLSKIHIDGIPVELACKLLPMKCRFWPNLALHLFFQSKTKARFEDPLYDRPKEKTLTLKSLEYIAASLEDACGSLQFTQEASEWGDYYDEINYSPLDFSKKKMLVHEIVCDFGGELAIDFGANTGVFSNLLAKHFKHVLALDKDYLAAEKYWRDTSRPFNVMPLVFDLANPSPGIGLMNNERRPLAARVSADLVCALALTHHLRVTHGIPFAHQARMFAEYLKPDGHLLIEYVGKNDSQTKKIMKERVFADYNDPPKSFEEAFILNGFDLVSMERIGTSHRTLYLFQKK